MPRLIPPLGLTMQILRTIRGWSQPELASAVKVTRETIGHYENASGLLGLGKLERIASAMGYVPEDVALTLLYLGAVVPVALDAEPAVLTQEELKRARSVATRLGLVETQRAYALLLDFVGLKVADTRPEAEAIPRLTLKLLRIGSGWTQAKLAMAAGMHAGTISVYESGPSGLRPVIFDKLVSAMGYAPSDVRMTALYLRTLLLVGPSTHHLHARTLAIRIGIAGARRWAAILLDRAVDRNTEAAVEEARKGAERQWQVISRLPAVRQLEVIERSYAIHRWPIIERLCDESVNAAPRDAQASLHLATLALRVAELPPGMDGWLRGYAWAFVGNAHRLQFNRGAAELAFAKAGQLWDEDPPGPGCPLGRWRIFDLEASLRRDSRQFPVAFTLLGRALAEAPTTRSKARILLKREFTLEQAGDIQGALAVLDEAAPLVEECADPSLKWALEFNRATLLVHLGKLNEAESRLLLLRSIATERQAVVHLTRILWLRGRIEIGRGQRTEGRASLEQARREFEAIGFAFDLAYISLEIAVLDLEDGRLVEAASLASGIVGLLRLLRVERETLVALRVFCEAAKAHQATADMARSVIETWGKLGGRSNVG